MYDDFDKFELVIPAQEYWDERTEKFVTVDSGILVLKHNLVSLNKFESRNKIPLFSRNPITREQRIDYVKCMLINEVKDENIFLSITNADLKKVDEYINDSMTATVFSGRKERNVSGRFITAELVYYWMAAFNIPYYPCEEWHLNKLLTLIKVCSEEQKGPQKKSRRDAMMDQRALNEMRKKQLNTKG